MKHRSRQTVLVVFPLVIAFGACASKAVSPGAMDSASAVAPGPTGPAATTSASATSSGETSTPPMPADTFKNADFALGPPSPIKPVEAEKKEESSDAFLVLGGVPSDPTKTAPKARGTGRDPLANLAQGDGASGGEGAPRTTGMAAAAPAPGGMAQSGDWDRYTGGHGQGKIGAASEMRGTIERAEIQRVVRANVQQVQLCYEQGLTRQPSLEGRIVVKFVVAKTGTVAAVAIPESTLRERSVEQCIVGAAMKWTFPKPTGEGLATFTYPFILKPGN